MARKLDLEKYRTLIEEQRAELRRELKALSNQATGRDQLSRQAGSDNFDEAGGDAASETMQRNQDLAIIQNMRNMLASCEEALRRMADRTYGVCEICGRNIPKKRLDALPYATMCTECRARLGP